MDRFRQVEAFVCVAEEQSFNGAARRLSQSPPVVTRLINGLEERIGAILFARTTRRLALTEAGERFLLAAGPALEALRQAEDAAAGAQHSARGQLRITAPVLFGERVIAPIVRDFLDQFDHITVQTLFVDRMVHLLDEGVDIAIRLADLPDSSLSAIRVGAVRRVTVASPGYVERFGAPRTPGDLAAHRIINTTNLERPHSWAYQRGGKSLVAAIAPRLTVNTLRCAIDAACAGWGIARVLSYQTVELLRDGSLVEILPEFEDRITPVHLVHQDGAGAPAKTRAFLDYAAKRLRTDPHLLSASRENQPTAERELAQPLIKFP